MNLLALLLLGVAVVALFLKWGTLDADDDTTEEWERKAW